MHHDGHALAADEPDHGHHRPTGMASVHTRALVTWIAIYPLAVLGLSVLGSVAPNWPTALRVLVLTAAVVPITVYVTVPRLLLLVPKVSNVFGRERAITMQTHRAHAGLQTRGEGQ